MPGPFRHIQNLGSECPERFFQRIVLPDGYCRITQVADIVFFPVAGAGIFFFGGADDDTF